MVLPAHPWSVENCSTRRARTIHTRSKNDLFIARIWTLTGLLTCFALCAESKQLSGDLREANERECATPQLESGLGRSPRGGKEMKRSIYGMLTATVALWTNFVAAGPPCD